MYRFGHNIAGLLFAILGIYFAYQNMHHMGHGSNLFGVGEMTWMWFTMAVIHFLIRDCECKVCK